MYERSVVKRIYHERKETEENEHKRQSGREENFFRSFLDLKKSFIYT